MITLKSFKADEGDCFLVKIEEEEKTYNILIDGGKKDTYLENGLKTELLNIFDSETEKIDLMILTHIHDDHIGGIKALFEDDEIPNEILEKKIDNIWFNSAKIISDYCKVPEINNIKEREVELNCKSIGTQISKSQGYTLEKAIKDINKELNIVKALDEYKLGNIRFIVLSPDNKRLKDLHEKWPDINSTEISGSGGDVSRLISDMISKDQYHPTDSDEFNGSSISFIMEYKKNDIEKRILFLGDSFSEINLNSLNTLKSLGKLKYNSDNKLVIDIIKLSHHGSIRNFHEKILDIIDCKKFLISTNFSQNKYSIKRGIARVIGNCNEDSILYFNYNKIYEIFGTEYEKYKPICRYVDEKLEV